MGATFGKNENSMVSPTAALISLGLNVKEPLPTATEMVAACARAAEAVARTAVEKCMLTCGIETREFEKDIRKGMFVKREFEGILRYKM